MLLVLGMYLPLANAESGDRLSVYAAGQDRTSEYLQTGGSSWLAASKHDAAAMLSGLFSQTEAQGVAFIVESDKRFRSELLNWLDVKAPASSGVGKLLLTRTDSGFSVDIGTDELMVDWTLRF